MSDAKDDDKRTVHLVSQEGESFDVALSVGKMSELVKTMIDEEQEDDETQEIPLPNVKSAILAKVIEFAQHYKNEPMSEIEKVRNEVNYRAPLRLNLF
jgi:S-phase kinase-associated protein 1